VTRVNSRAKAMLLIRWRRFQSLLLR